MRGGVKNHLVQTADFQHRRARSFGSCQSFRKRRSKRRRSWKGRSEDDTGSSAPEFFLFVRPFSRDTTTLAFALRMELFNVCLCCDRTRRVDGDDDDDDGDEEA